VIGMETWCTSRRGMEARALASGGTSVGGGAQLGLW